MWAFVRRPELAPGDDHGAEVREVDLTEADVVDAVRSSLDAGGWVSANAPETTAELISMAGSFPVGTVVEQGAPRNRAQANDTVVSTCALSHHRHEGISLPRRSAANRRTARPPIGQVPLRCGQRTAIQRWQAAARRAVHRSSGSLRLRSDQSAACACANASTPLAVAVRHVDTVCVLGITGSVSQPVSPGPGVTDMSPGASRCVTVTRTVDHPPAPASPRRTSTAAPVAPTV